MVRHQTHFYNTGPVNKAQSIIDGQVLKVKPAGVRKQSLKVTHEVNVPTADKGTRFRSKMSSSEMSYTQSNRTTYMRQSIEQKEFQVQEEPTFSHSNT
jgi:hypothetical protein